MDAVGQATKTSDGEGAHMTRLGYQIPNFTYPGVGPEGFFASLIQQAKTAGPYRPSARMNWAPP